MITKGSVRTVASVLLGGKFIARVPKMADELVKKMLDVKLLTQFKKATGFTDELLSLFKKDLKAFLEVHPSNAEDILKIADYTSAQELADIVQNLNKLKNVEGIDKVVADMGTYWTKFKGSKFQLDYAADLFTNGKNVKFEVSNLSDDLKRIYDIEYDDMIDGISEKIKLELKNWNNFYPSTIKDQFVRDLVKMNKLGDIQWIFNKTDKISSLEELQKNVLSALKKADGSPIDELFENLDADKVRSLFSTDELINETNYANRLLKNLEEKDIFDQIFEVTK